MAGPALSGGHRGSELGCGARSGTSQTRPERRRACCNAGGPERCVPTRASSCALPGTRAQSGCGLRTDRPEAPGSWATAILRIKGGAWGGTLSGKDLWSANLPWVDAPYLRMIRVLASLLDEDDNCILAGFRELVRPYTDEEREEVRILEERFDEETMRQALGIARFRGGRPGRELVSRYVMEPMLNVVGIVGGYTGPKIFTTLPMEVTAKLDFRLVPGQRREDIPRLLRKHLDSRGFNEVEIADIGGYEYSRTPASDPVYQAAIRACQLQQSPLHFIEFPTVMPRHPAYRPGSPRGVDHPQGPRRGPAAPARSPVGPVEEPAGLRPGDEPL